MKQRVEEITKKIKNRLFLYKQTTTMNQEYNQFAPPMQPNQGGFDNQFAPPMQQNDGGFDGDFDGDFDEADERYVRMADLKDMSQPVTPFGKLGGILNDGEL